MGLPKGYRHSGQFQKGVSDPRRFIPRRKLVPGTQQTLPELCRLRTVEALDVITTILRDTKAPVDVRRKCADSILDRGWGKPDQLVKVEGGQASQDLKSMTTTELLALLMEKHDEDRTLEGETEPEQLEDKTE